MNSCVCFSATKSIELRRDAEGKLLPDDFIELREKCLALRHILLPEGRWSKVSEWLQDGDDVASHSSIVLIAFLRGYLPKLTGPIHRYLLSESGIRPEVRKQYSKDLDEKWMLYSDPGKRHEHARRFRGRLVELQYTEWLESQNHRISGMEAIRLGTDIETQSPNGVTNSYEVKFFGMEDHDFQIMIESRNSGSSMAWISPYQAINYLLFRVYQASCQLASAPGERIVVIVIDALAWLRFDTLMTHDWIDLKNPTFKHEEEEGWKRFMDNQRNGGPSAADLRRAFSNVNRVKVYQQNAAFEFTLEFDAPTR